MIPHRFCRAAIAALALLAGLAASARADLVKVYGVSALGHQLVSIDPTTGAGTVIGDLGANVLAVGLGASGGGLYTFDANSDRILRLDPTSGATVAVIDIGIADRIGDGDLALRPDGIGFLATPLDPTTLAQTNDLYRFDIATGSSVRVGTTDVSLQGLAFVGSTLYGLSVDQDSLYIVDQSTGALGLVGVLGVGAGSPFAGLTAGAGGVLYASLDDRLYSIDRLTGLASAVDPGVDFIGTSSISGLAAVSVPEPASLVLSGSGLVVVLVWARRLGRSPRGR